MKNFAVFMLLIGIALMFSACNKKACKRACECAHDNSDSCVEDCEDELDKQSDDCQKAFRKAAKCAHKENCDSSACSSEYTDLNAKCNTVTYYNYYK